MAKLDEKSKNELKGRIKKVIMTSLNVSEEAVSNEDSTFTGDLGADSLDLVELVMAFEDEFNVEIPDDVADKIHTINDAINQLLDRIENKA